MKYLSLIMLLSLLSGTLFSAPPELKSAKFKTEEEKAILEAVRPYRPYYGGEIPANLAQILGTAHVSGRYNFTDQPFIVEGSEAIYGLGMRAIKLWLTKLPVAYRFNSEWNLSKYPTYVEMVSHPYYKEALEVPFSVVALEIYPAQYEGRKDVAKHSFDPDDSYSEDEKQVYDLAVYLMNTYKDREVTFLLQNWEGNWMFQGGARKEWKEGVYPELERRSQAFIRWFEARQRGVDRARADVKDTKVKIYHAIEVNGVLEGIPNLCNQVLPHVTVDMISWSCYGYMKSWEVSGDITAVSMCKGFDVIQSNAKTHLKNSEGKPLVYIGEMGIPENTNKTPDQIMDVMDGFMGAMFYKKIPYVLHWELYCNEPIAGQDKFTFDDAMTELRGYWLIRPDGSYSHTMRYLDLLLKNAGHRLPKSERVK